MNPQERFKRLVLATGLSLMDMAEVFGVEVSTANKWYYGLSKMQFEFQQTLLRLEADNLPKLAPGLSPKVMRAFSEGRHRAEQQMPGEGYRYLPSGRKAYPLKSMVVGQTIFVPADNRSIEQMCDSLTSCIANCRKRTGFKFSTHRTKTGVEVTRIA